MSASESDVRQRLRERLQQPSRGDQVRQQLKERLGQSSGAAQDETSAFGSFVSRLLHSTGDALLATPSAAAELARAMQPMVSVERAAYEAIGRRSPADALVDAIPRPTTHELQAGVTAAAAAVPGGRSPREAYREDLAAREALTQQRRDEHPIASAAGDIGGDIAALLLTKNPLQGAIRRAEQRLTRRPEILFGGAQAAEATPGVSRTVERALNSNLARYGARGGFRAAETGLEAAYLEVISEAENDPLLAAGLAAGGQVGASLSIEALKASKNLLPGKPLLSMGVSALSAAGLWQMLKSATPGGRDRILESVETGYDKVTYAVLLGVLGAAVGSRARDSKLYEDLLPISEAALTVPRGAVLSLLSDFIDAPEEEQQQLEATLDRMMADPAYEGESDLEKRIVQRLSGASERD